MNTYISLLRGINVSGKNSIKMDALKNSFAQLGLKDIKTYIQSGNIVFRYKKEVPQKLAGRIKEQIQNDFSIDVPVQVFSLDKFKQLVAGNPFATESSKDISFMHVTLLAAAPENPDISAIESKKAAGEEIAIFGDAVYLYCPIGYGRTKLNNNFLESKLKVSATTRNWKTTLKLLELASA